MGENSAIEWTDHTFNPWEGCTKVSAGCAHCYAETRNARWHGGQSANWGPGAPRRKTSEANWRKPLTWNRRAERTGIRPRVFCASLADWLDAEAPLTWLAELLNLIRTTPHLDWLMLSKRPENWNFRLNQVGWLLDDKPDEDTLSNKLRTWLADWLFSKRPPENVWIGTTVENQAAADQRIVQLLEIPAKLRFLSCEPLLEPIDLSAFIGRSCSIDDVIIPYNLGIDWVIAGGESGPGARPMHPDWPRKLRDQCEVADVPFLFKQWGEYAPGHPEGFTERRTLMECHWGDGEISVRVGKKAAGRVLDGREWNQLPDW